MDNLDDETARLRGISDGKLQFTDLAPAHRTPAVRRAACWKDGTNLQHVARRDRDTDLCKLAVTCGDALQWVPDEQLTDEMLELACRHHGVALRHVDAERITATLCHVAVSQDAVALQHVPVWYRSAALCRQAVVSVGATIAFTPTYHRTAHLCGLAMQNLQEADFMRHFPEGIFTVEWYQSVLRSSPHVFKWVPARMRTEAVVLAAVRVSGMALKYVPLRSRSPVVCLAAVCRDPDVLLTVLPSSAWTETLVLGHLCHMRPPRRVARRDELIDRYANSARVAALLNRTAVRFVCEQPGCVYALLRCAHCCCGSHRFLDIVMDMVADVVAGTAFGMMLRQRRQALGLPYGPRADARQT